MLNECDEVGALVNNASVAIMHDRHLSFQPAIKATLPLCLDRVDIVHLVRNIRVRIDYFF
jgi:hypothetical protein